MLINSYPASFNPLETMASAMARIFRSSTLQWKEFLTNLGTRQQANEMRRFSEESFLRTRS